MVSTWVSLKNNRAYVYLVALGATDDAPSTEMLRIPACPGKSVRSSGVLGPADIVQDTLQNRVCYSLASSFHSLIESRVIRLPVTRGEGRVTFQSLAT